MPVGVSRCGIKGDVGSFRSLSAEGDDREQEKRNKSVVRHERSERERRENGANHHLLWRRDPSVDWLPVSCFARRVMSGAITALG